MKTLSLFNCVLAKETEVKEPFICTKLGLIITTEALWLKEEIIEFFKTNKLNGASLNKTFHKKWNRVINSSREELFLEQIKHYVSTYGTNFSGEIYIPNELLEIDDLGVKFTYVTALSKEELITKGLNMFKSGVALKRETIDDILTMLIGELGYSFNGTENIKNKEVIVILADNFGILPKSPNEYLRYLVYKLTNETLLIKNAKLINLLKNSKVEFDVSKSLNDFGLKELSTIFNRFKPLFLAIKGRAPKEINKIAKLSKTNHIPMVENPLIKVTSKKLTENDIHWLDNANIFSLFKALQALNNRLKGQSDFIINIRNGKGWITKDLKINEEICLHNFEFILFYLKNKFNFNSTSFYIPKDVEYSLPTSEKLYVGNLPMGTKINVGDEPYAFGVYWENNWGIRDLDLSAISLTKIGWNSAYSQGGVTYSGDMTDASNGAVEFLLAKEIDDVYLVTVNIFNGFVGSKCKIIAGKTDSLDRNYMMNPENLFFEIEENLNTKQTYLGLMKKNSFILYRNNIGSSHISYNNEQSKIAREAMLFLSENQLTFNWFVNTMGGVITSDITNADYDLSLDKLEKDTFFNLEKYVKK